MFPGHNTPNIHHYPDSEQTSPVPILVMSNTRLSRDNDQTIGLTWKGLKPLTFKTGSLHSYRFDQRIRFPLHPDTLSNFSLWQWEIACSYTHSLSTWHKHRFNGNENCYLNMREVFAITTLESSTRY